MSNCSNKFYWKDYPFFIELCLHICQKSAEHIFMDLVWFFYSVPLIYMYIPLLIPHCLDDYSHNSLLFVIS